MMCGGGLVSPTTTERYDRRPEARKLQAVTRAIHAPYHRRAAREKRTGGRAGRGGARVTRLDAAEHGRLDRFVTELRGGGVMNVPALFSALLEEMLNNGPTPVARLAEIATSAPASNPRQVKRNWAGSWVAMTTEALEQMAAKGIVKRDGGDRWQLGPAFCPGEWMEGIPPRRGLNPARKVIVWPKEERERQNLAARAEGEKRAVINATRRISAAVRTQLQVSREQYGPANPILVDAHDRIIDGRHRYAADPSWPRQVMRRADGQKISTDEEVVAAKLMLDAFNKHQKLPPDAVARLERVLGELSSARAIKRSRIETELRRDATRSERTIAELLGVGNQLVGDVREELCDSHSIHRYAFRGGKGVRSGEHAAACWCGQGDARAAAASQPRARGAKRGRARQAATYPEPKNGIVAARGRARWGSPSGRYRPSAADRAPRPPASARPGGVTLADISERAACSVSGRRTSADEKRQHDHARSRERARCVHLDHPALGSDRRARGAPPSHLEAPLLRSGAGQGIEAPDRPRARS
jgi:hypothetical protein